MTTRRLTLEQLRIIAKASPWLVRKQAKMRKTLSYRPEILCELVEYLRPQDVQNHLDFCQRLIDVNCASGVRIVLDWPDFFTKRRAESLLKRAQEKGASAEIVALLLAKKNELYGADADEFDLTL